MDERVVRELNELTKRFYARFGDSFSDMRTSPWPGWERLAEMMRAKRLCEPGRGVRVLDVGCGNGRFERFLQNRFPEVNWEFCLVENAPAPEVAVFDVVEGLLAGEPLPFADADLTVAFGLMHHIPSEALRERALAAFMAATRIGGLCAVSLWRFMDDEGLAAKARAVTAAAAPLLADMGIDPAALEPHDFILGWQDAAPEDGAMRYCHHFDDDEIDRLVASVKASFSGTGPATRFEADGRTGALNTYLVFARSEEGEA